MEQRRQGAEKLSKLQGEQLKTLQCIQLHIQFSQDFK